MNVWKMVKKIEPLVGTLPSLLTDPGLILNRASSANPLKLL